MTRTGNSTPPTPALEGGSLYVVATPIGNLGDFSVRAKATLEAVDCILCEDTRVTSRLLTKYGISKLLLSYHRHSRLTRTNQIITDLRAGRSFALVSDAGTPGIADPGQQLIATIRLQSPATTIITIPGANAAVAAISVSGFPSDHFVFLGFPPHKKGRQTFFRHLADQSATAVFYESPHRILKTLASLTETMPDRQLMIGRELTKIHEDLQWGTAEALLKHYTDHPGQVKGEFVLVVAPR